MKGDTIMSNISTDVSAWRAIPLTKKVTRTPYMSVNQKLGRVGFNLAACDLISEIFFFTYCTPLQKEDENGNVSVGFLFSKEATDSSLNLHKTMSKGKHKDVSSAFVYSRALTDMLVKYLGITEEVTQFHVVNNGNVMLYATNKVPSKHPNTKDA